MEIYRYRLIDGREAEVFNTDPHCDSKIRTYNKREITGEATLWNAGFILLMPRVLRFCLEEEINIFRRDYLSHLPFSSDSDITNSPEEVFFMSRVISDLEIELKRDEGTGVRSIRDKLVIGFDYERVFFEREDIPELIEAMIRSFNHIPEMQVKCIKAIEVYKKLYTKG